MVRKLRSGLRNILDEFEYDVVMKNDVFMQVSTEFKKVSKRIVFHHYFAFKFIKNIPHPVGHLIIDSLSISKSAAAPMNMSFEKDWF